MWDGADSANTLFLETLQDEAQCLNRPIGRVMRAENAHATVASLRYARMTRDVGPELIAAVAVDPMGGTVLDVRVGYRSVPYLFFVVAGLFAAVGAWGFAGSPFVVLPHVMAAGLVAFHVMLVRESNAALLARGREPAYLIERLERALASARVPPIRSPAG